MILLSDLHWQQPQWMNICQHHCQQNCFMAGWCHETKKDKSAICFNIHGIQLRQPRKALMAIFNAHHNDSTNPWWSSIVKAYSLLQTSQIKALALGTVTVLCINVCHSCFISYLQDPAKYRKTKQIMIQINSQISSPAVTKGNSFARYRRYVRFLNIMIL